MTDEINPTPVELATEITIAWLNNPNNRVSTDDVPNFLRTIHATVQELATGASSSVAPEETKENYIPAVSVRRSLASKDHILSLIDGKPYKTLTRHLSTHGLTAQEYRHRYNLRADYPMVAENYAARRRELAKSIGLGRRSAVAAAAPDPAVASAPPVKAKGAATAKLKAAPAKATKPAAKRQPVKAAAADASAE